MLVSGITAVIHGREEPFGLLCAHYTNNRAFMKDGISFMQAVANVLWVGPSSVMRHRRGQRR